MKYLNDRLQAWQTEKFLLLALLLIGVVIFFYNAGNYYLWEDEGSTAFFGKSILKYGLPYGFDGRNLLEYKNGVSLNQKFLSLYDPWAQYYVSAMSQFLFGMDSFGARALFILFGLGAVFMQYFFVRSYFQSKDLAFITSVLMTTSVIFILYSRQCRYYALGMFLSPLIAYLYCSFKNRIYDVLLVTVLFVILFFSTSVIGMILLISMAVAFFVFDDKKKAVAFFIKPIPVLVITASLFLWWLNSYGRLTNPTFLQNLSPLDFMRIFWLYLKDYNETQLLPVGVMIILVSIWFIQGQFSSKQNFFQIRKELAIIFMLMIFTLIISIVSPQNSNARHSDIRYATLVFPFLILVQAFVIYRIYLWKRLLALISIIIIVGTNLLTFMPLRSYLIEYTMETIRPFDNSYKVAVQYLNSRVKQDQVIFVSPNYRLWSMEYYLGDKVLFCNVVSEDNKNLLAAGVHLPQYIYSSDVRPDWIVFFGTTVDLPHTFRHFKKIDLGEYKTHIFPIYGPDVSRPELFWRSFKPIRNYLSSQSLIILERTE